MLNNQEPVERKANPQEDDKSLSTMGWVLVISILFIIPSIIGVILYFVLHDLIYLETCFAIMGVLVLLVMMFRIRIRDGRNLKKTKSIKEDKSSPSYKAFISSQVKLGVVGVALLVVSALIFLFGFLASGY